MAIVFTSTVKDLLNSLMRQQDNSVQSNDNKTFQLAKQSIAKYVMEHDELEQNSQTIQQILNSANAEHIEIILRTNLDYCDECLLKMYRRITFN